MKLVPFLSALVGSSAPEKLPGALGEYPVLAQVHQITRAEDHANVYLAHLEARLTLTPGKLPAQYKEVPLLKRLPLVAASLHVTGSLETKLDGHAVTVSDPSTTVLLIPQADLAKALYAAYGVNLASLSGLLGAVDPDHWSDSDASREMRHTLAKKAFGYPDHGEPPGRKSLPVLTGERGHVTTPPFTVPTTGYYYLSDVYYLAALLDLVTAKEIPLPLPASDCVIRFSGEGARELALVVYLDRAALDGSDPVLLEVRPEYGKTTNDLLAEIFRYRHEIREAREQRRQILDAFFRLGQEAKPERTLSETEAAEQEQLRREAEQLYAKDTELQERLLALYAALTQWATKHKERILKTVREKQRIAGVVSVAQSAMSARAGGFVELPNNMDMLPAHFAAIPKGLTDGLELTSDTLGRAILRVGRPPLDLEGHKTRTHTALTLPLSDLGEKEKSAAFEQAKLILGEGGPRWLLPQGLVAVSKLYREGGGYSKEGFVHRLYLNDWIDTMRPLQVPRFKEKGRGEAFGKDKERNPKDLFHALLGVLHRLSYARENGPEWSQLSGFYIAVEHGEDTRGPWVDIMLNPNLHKFVIGAEGLPYMMTDTKAMFSYDRASLDYTPAAQWGLEQLARENLYQRDTATLSDPHGGGITRLALAHRFGLIKGREDKPHHLLRRFNGILDNLGNAGVLAEVKLDGREKTGAEAFSVKLHVSMHDDYRKAYNLTREKHKLAAIDKALEAPFAPPKPPKRLTSTGAPRRRGRPPKKA